LPDQARATAAGLPVSGPVYLGLRIDPAGAVPELNHYDQSGVHRGADWERLTVVTPVTASGGNHTLAGADVLTDPNSRVSGALTAGETEWYQLTVPANARLTVRVTAATGTLAPLLTLAGPDGQVLVQSDSGIVQYLPPGSYALSISAVSGAGAYRLTSEYVEANSPLGPAFPNLAQQITGSVVVADLNNDGIPDIVRLGVRVQLGNGDGTFGPPQTFTAPGGRWLTVADVNGDGHPDIIVANQGSYKSPSSVGILLGNGDGTFQPEQIFAVGFFPDQVVVADVNGDGKPDLITVNQGGGSGSKYPGSVSVLLGNGDGTFRQQHTFAISSGRVGNASLAVTDLNGDGIPDLVTNARGIGFFGRETVWLGNGDGTFRQPQVVPVDSGGYELAVVDVNGDGKPDIITDNQSDYVYYRYAPPTVSLLLGNGDGTFQPPKIMPTGGAFNVDKALNVADVNGDGKPDIVTQYSMLIGNGDGTFQPPSFFFLGAVAVADVNGDGKPDLVVLLCPSRCRPQAVEI
jgi:hypothetical protein